MSQVFISYSHQNTDFAKRIKDDLDNNGIICWMDPDISGGEEWERIIFQSIQNADVFVVCVSPESIESEYVQLELKYARNFGKRIIPIMNEICLREIERSSNNEIRRLLDIQVIVFENRYDSGLSNLLKSIKMQDAEELALSGMFEQSGQSDFKSMIQERIRQASSITLSGIGLNVLGDATFASEVMQRAVNNNCVLNIFLANPFHPSVQTRLIEEEIGELSPPVGKSGLIARLRSFLDMWEKLGKPANVTINLINHYPTFAYLIVDDEYFFYPYGYAQIGNFSPVLHFSSKSTKSRYFTAFIDKHHERLKKSSLGTEITYHLIKDSQSLLNRDFPSMAIYYIPPARSSLYTFGSNVLGYDIREKQLLESEWDTYVGGARNFGFHMTLCDALFFPTDSEIDLVEAELNMLLQEFSSFRLTNLQIQHTFPDDNSMAVTFFDDSGKLEALHHELVFRVYRKAIGSNYTSGEALSNRDDKFDRNQLMISRYHAPYILNSFHPHFTLLTQVPPSKKSEIYAELGNAFAGYRNNFYVDVDRISILYKPSDSDLWEIKREIKLGH